MPLSLLIQFAVGYTMAFVRVYIRMADVIMRLDTRVRLVLVVDAYSETE